ncbi:sigma-54 interaction domain-containing protein [Abyssisolibacter fermentans]|uniref:sigma-54 interaction domain-containing protein n=1 Tax=Abyssisolibacter fermentans TaxID=1766203 RepID=UPI00082B06C7|nr:sigma 54-interacting transcriptional regulator [Abyssisolibacter fermentans]
MRKDLEIILNSTHDGMIAVDKNGIITLFNKEAERLIKIKAEEALGKHVVGIVPNTKLPYILKTGEYQLNRHQTLIGVEIITNRIPVEDENGEIIGAVAVFRDISDIVNCATEITGLKEMKSMLTAIFNSTQDAITVVDQNGINIMINTAYTKLTGLTEEDIIGKPATFDISEGESIQLKVLKTKDTIKNVRMKVGPHKKEVIATAAPIIVDDELRGSVGVLKDLSEVKELTEKLKVAKKIIRKLEAKYTFDDIIAQNYNMVSAIEKAKKAALLPITVLLRGESGTGKEVFAHAIHTASDRKYNQFIRVNCASLNETLLESELFGYEEGAFTGAKKGGKKGLFEEAQAGTIFLDEIGDISLNTQVKLLRVIQEKEVVRVGGVKPININVRIIAATNMDLEKAILEGRFREDLYYRLSVMPIMIPPLRLRKDEIYVLSINCIDKLNRDYGRNVQDISDEAIDIMKEHDWPGNVRELENVIGRALINMKVQEKIILPRHISIIDQFRHVESSKSNQKYEDMLSNNIKLDENIRPLSDITKEIEKKYIIKVLKQNKNNKTKTANDLKISIRNLYYKMEKYNIQEN